MTHNGAKMRAGLLSGENYVSDFDARADSVNTVYL
jgi:hypothetical protein